MQMVTKIEQRWYFLDKIESQKLNGDKEGHDMMIKGSIHQQDITIINIYAPNIIAPNYMKQMLTELSR